MAMDWTTSLQHKNNSKFCWPKTPTITGAHSLMDKDIAEILLGLASGIGVGSYVTSLWDYTRFSSPGTFCHGWTGKVVDVTYKDGEILIHVKTQGLVTDQPFFVTVRESDVQPYTSEGNTGGCTPEKLEAMFRGEVDLSEYE